MNKKNTIKRDIKKTESKTMNKTTTVKKQTKKKSNKKEKGFYRIDEFSLNDGDILVYRTNKSGEFWAMSIWIPGEKRYFKKSLRTKDKEKATELAKSTYLEIQSKVISGFQVFDKSLGELVDLYLEEQKDRIRIGHQEVGKGSTGITKQRFTTKQTQLKNHLLGFIPENTKLSTIKSEMFKRKYTQYRRKKNREVEDVTIINERAEIGALFRFGLKKEWIKHNQLPEFEEMRKEPKSRPHLTREQWREIYTYIRYWNKHAEDSIKPTGGYTLEEEINKRDFVRYFILILCNTGLRFGELRYLRWRDVSLIKETDGSVTSEIDVHISKTGKRLGVIGRKGEYFQKVKKISKFTSGNDFIFVDNETGDQLGKKTLYRLWKEIINNTSLKESTKKYVYYCLRHTYCTYRLQSGTDIYRLSKNMGTSVKHIEDTYSHIKLDEDRKILTGGKMSESDKVLLEM